MSWFFNSILRRPAWRGALMCLVWVWAASTAHAAEPTATAPATSWLVEFVHRHGVWVGLSAVFVSGALLNLTPCVYPMIPVTIAFFSGQAAFSTNRSSTALGRAALLAGCYVIGLSFSYAVLGVVAASTGALLGSWLQHPAVIGGIAVVIIALSLSMFGLYELRPPGWITRRIGQASAGYGGAFVMGLVMGVVAAPCIGPFVLGLFLLVSQLGNPAAGFLLFFVLGLGMGVPYVVLGVSAHRISRLPRAGTWLVWSKKGLGVILAGLALYFVRPLLPAHFFSTLVLAALIGAGIYLGWAERSMGHGRAFWWVRRLVGSALILAAVVVAWPRPAAVASVAWTPYSDEAFGQAQRDGKRILVDIYADWCLPCVEMDHVTFRHPDVIDALSPMATFRVDVTRDVPQEAQALIDRYQVFGAPTVLLFDHDGKERSELRVMGFVKPEELLERLSNLP